MAGNPMPHGRHRAAVPHEYASHFQSSSSSWRHPFQLEGRRYSRSRGFDLNEQTVCQLGNTGSDHGWKHSQRHASTSYRGGVTQFTLECAVTTTFFIPQRTSAVKKGVGTQPPRNSPKTRSEELKSQTMRRVTSSGTASRAPGMPQIQPQKNSASSTATGLSVKRKLWMKGVMSWPSTVASARYTAGGRRA